MVLIVYVYKTKGSVDKYFAKHKIISFDNPFYELLLPILSN